MALEVCPLCGGQACEENCGIGGSSPIGCRHANDGPDSHRVCVRCGGRGRVEVEESGPEPEPIKYMDLTEFREKGFLQEANRQFFHPLGLALEWDTGWTKEGLEQFVRRQINLARERQGREPAAPDSPLKFGVIDAIWDFIQKVGLDKPRLTGVWDYRDDPEGMQFGWDHMDTDEVIQRWINVSEEFTKHVPARRALFGEEGMEPTSVLVTSIQALPKKTRPHTSQCSLGLIHKGPCRP